MKLQMLFLVSLIAPCLAGTALDNLCNCESMQKQLNETTSELNIIKKRFQVKDCSYAFWVNLDGVADLIPFDDQSKSVRAMCDMTTSPGGWTVIQRRYDGSVDFYRNWNAYKNGFGDPAGEYWIGLEAIHHITKAGNYMLRIDLEDRTGDVGYATYSEFAVGSEETNYRLQISGYTGNVYDSMTPDSSYYNLNGMMFSTNDQDHDDFSDNCAADNNHGAWWYNHCSLSNLNGDYSVEVGVKGLMWYYWKSYNKNIKTMKTTKMMIRPKV